MMPPALADRVLYGDALTVLRTFPSGIAQTCVCSPPYWSLKDYGTRSWIGGAAECGHEAHAIEQPSVWRGGDGNPVPSRSCSRCAAWFGEIGMEPTVEAYIRHLVAAFAEVQRVVRDTGTLWVVMGDAYNAYGNRSPSQGLSAHGDASRPTWTAGGLTTPTVGNKSLMGLPWRLALALQDGGWILRNDCIWRKERHAPERVTDRFPRGHEYVFMFSKNDRYLFNADDGIARLDTVWTIPTESGRGGHPAPFPRQLAARCIRAGSRPGDLVLDCFAGSGTTLEVAKDLDRRFLGIELNKRYRAHIEARVGRAVARSYDRAAYDAMTDIAAEDEVRVDAASGPTAQAIFDLAMGGDLHDRPPPEP